MSKRILIIDDEENIRQMTRLTLTEINRDELMWAERWEGEER